MVNTCVVGGCGHSFAEHVRLLKWPKSDAVAAKWDAFVRSGIKNWTRTKYSVICCGHFNHSCFMNLTEWLNGFATNLRVSPEAVPSKKLADLEIFKKRKSLKRQADEKQVILSLIMLF